MCVNCNSNYLAFYKDYYVVKKYYKRVKAIFLNRAITYKKPYKEKNKQNLNFTLIIKRKCTVAD